MVYEEQVMDTLKTIQTSDKMISDMIIEYCGNDSKWFIRFICSDKRWETLRVNVVRVFDYLSIPDSEEKRIYTTD